MRRSLSTIKLYVFLGFFLAATPAWGNQSQLIENNSNLCSEQTSKMEHANNIPRHLLTAISLVESGFWVPERKANIAWPWTVTSGQNNWYFATKEDAITQVLELWSNGVSNIDVGCMQINLHYHGGAFRDLEQALDPASNVAYASKYLKNLYTSTRSWTKAAAYYHSTTPERYRPYKLKVIKLWNEARRSSGNVASGSGASARGSGNGVHLPGRSLVSIDRDRTRKLNARMRASRVAVRKENPKNVRQQQLASWRNSNVAGDPSATFRIASMRRAELGAKLLRKLHGVTEEDSGASFVAKRITQLQSWRANR